MKYYWVDIDGFNTQIYLGDVDDIDENDHTTLAGAKKEAIEYLKSVINMHKDQIKYIKSLKAKDIKNKEY